MRILILIDFNFRPDVLLETKVEYKLHILTLVVKADRYMTFDLVIGHTGVNPLVIKRPENTGQFLRLMVKANQNVIIDH